MDMDQSDEAAHHDAIEACNAHAVIPPRMNAKLWKPDTAGARARNEAIFKVSGTCPVATVDLLSPAKPRRDQDTLCETTLSAPSSARLRSAGRGDLNPCRDP